MPRCRLGRERYFLSSRYPSFAMAARIVRTTVQARISQRGWTGIENRATVNAAERPTQHE